MSSKILITGGTGFVGSWLIEEILASTDWDIYSLERITPRMNALGALAFSPRIHRIYHDFRAEIPKRILDECEGVDYIIHNGAEVHGLRSLENPAMFIHTNVMGTFNMLEAARVLKPRKFLYVSSAEAVGSAPAPLSYDENVTLRPSNPYAAAKASGEMLVRSYQQSFGINADIVRSMNIFGERQDTSKFLPAVIKKILNGDRVQCHVDAHGVSGSRHWIYVRTLVEAILRVLQLEWSNTYHIVGPEITNLKVIQLVANILNRPVNIQTVQPGPSHDMRYSIRDTKLPPSVYDASFTINDLVHTIMWYSMNPEWLA